MHAPMGEDVLPRSSGLRRGSELGLPAFMLHQTMCLRTFERRESPDLAYMRQKLDDEFRETERGGVRGVLAEG